MRRAGPGIAIVHAPTRLEGLRRRWGTLGQAKFLLARAHEHEQVRREAPAAGQRRFHSGKRATTTSPATAQADFREYQAEDDAYRRVLEQVVAEVGSELPLRMVDRSFLATFDFGGSELVVVVGQDGLVANTAKYAGDLPIVAINPDPRRIDGVLLPFSTSDVKRIVHRVLAGAHRTRSITLAEVNLNDGQRMLAFNDFFVGAASHISARYVIEANGQSEPQSSSGLIVSTGAGSTGWMSSVFNMAQGVAGFLTGNVAAPPSMDWEDRRLLWAVREPFVSKRSRASLVAGWVHEGQQLVVESLMPESGVIFSDGIEADFLTFHSGTIARIGVSSQQAHLVVG